MSAPSLCSALAIADSNAFLMMTAALRGVKLRMLRAWSTFLPRMRSATSRPLSDDSRTPRTIDLVSVAMCRPLFLHGLLVGRVTLEDAGRGELTELVAHHLVGHVHRHVLLAVVHGDRQPDEIGQDRRTARPGLDRLLVLDGRSLLDLAQQVVVHERTLLQ